MIRTLVVDDDYRVAHIHGASVERIDGFTCVGEAHSAAEARSAIAELNPDLLLLDVYLPDEDGLSLLRSLNVPGERTIDCILVTAARDVETVRTAFRIGALRYLVKPFGFAQLREQLESYRQWRERIDASVLVQRHVPLAGKRGVRIVGRRNPANPDAPVAWNFVLDKGLEPDQTGVLDAAEEALKAVRDEFGI